jgi:predicted membrane protein
MKFFSAFAFFSAIFGLIVWIGNVKIAMAWPLPLSAVGLAGIFAGIRKRSRISADFIIPSVAFLMLSVFFCLFSFGIISMRLKDFLVAYWPIALLSALVLSFIALLYSRRDSLRGSEPNKVFKK